MADGSASSGHRHDERRPERDGYRPGELAAVLERIPGVAPLELRDRAMTEVAAALGLRPEAVVELDVADAERLVAAAGSARDALERWLERGRPALVQTGADSEPALFVSKTGRRLSASDVRRRMALAARRAAVVTTLTPAATSTGGAYTRVESKRLRRAYASAHPRA